MEALVEVREALRDLVDIQVVALTPADGGPGWRGPPARCCARRSTWASTSSAGARTSTRPRGLPRRRARGRRAAAGRPIDLHTDETLDPEVLGLRDLARLVSTTASPTAATASHCVSLGMQDDGTTQHEVAAEVAEAGIAVVTLPQTNLFLQGHGIAPRRPEASPPSGRCSTPA